MPRIFPDAAAENRVICVTGQGESAEFSCLMADLPPNRHYVVGTQCFPLYLYDEEAEASAAAQNDLFTEASQVTPLRARRYALTDTSLSHFQGAYSDAKISKEDVFYYVYGLLHSPDYRERFADNLGKELPRIPCVATADDFRAFSAAGRRLAELHLHYEEVPMFPVQVEGDDVFQPPKLSPADYRVEKMRFGKAGKEKDLSTVQYNHRITVRGIPLDAYKYVVNGKPAIEWVMERQAVKVDKASGIVNDANDWAVETMHNPRYPLELLLRVITVSVETMQIINALPKMDISEGG